MLHFLYSGSALLTACTIEVTTTTDYCRQGLVMQGRRGKGGRRTESLDFRAIGRSTNNYFQLSGWQALLEEGHPDRRTDLKVPLNA